MNNLHLSKEAQTVADTESDYRFLVSGNYLVFYRAYGKDVYIDRVLYGRHDYMRILSGDAQADEKDK